MKKLLTILICLLLSACGTKKEIVEEEFNIIGIWEVVSATYNDVTFTVKELESMNDYSCSGIYLVIKDGGSIIGFEKNENSGTIFYSQDEDILTLESGYTLEPQENGRLNLVMDNGYMTLKKYSDSEDITRVPEYKDPSDEVVEEIIEEPVVEEVNQMEEKRSGIRPEFKEAMDAYEEFYTDYIDLLKRYDENPTDLLLLAEYTKMLMKIDEMDKKFEAWDDGDLSSEEFNYYLDVQNRVLKKMNELY